MIPVDQTMTVAEHGTGNCLAATIASVLEVSIDEVPNLVNQDTWFEDMVGFMRRRGFEYVCYIDARPDGSWPELEQEEIDAFGGCVLASGFTDRIYPEGHEMAGKPILHAVVMDWATKTVAHDPHPSKAGLTRFYDAIVFRKAATPGGESISL